MKNAYFIEKLDLCCKTKRLKRTAFCKDIGISEATVRTWIRQGNYPQADTLYKIAKYFGVPMEYFIDGSEIQFTDREMVQLIRMKNLSDDQLKMISFMIEKFTEENEKVDKK